MVRHRTLTPAFRWFEPSRGSHFKIIIGSLAQLVEHLTFNQRVSGSNPERATRLIIKLELKKFEFLYFNLYIINYNITIIVVITLIIRKANYDDVKTINNFLTLLIRDERQYDSGINENFVVTNMYENYIGDSHKLIIVALENDKIVGYLYGLIKPADETYKYIVAKLDALYVDNNYRHKNIATSLIEYFKKWALEKEAHKIEVSVCYDNVKAKHLYEKNNFKVTSETLTFDIL